MSTTEHIPLTVPIDLAGELLGMDRQAAYRMAKSGALRVLPGPGRKKVSLASLSKLLEHELTAADIEAARDRLAPKRSAFLDYQATYRRERAAVSTRRAGAPRQPAEGARHEATFGQRG
jgi:hypothetical protein